MEAQVRGAEIALADDRLVAVENELIGLAREVIAPQSLFLAHDEIGVVAFARPGKSRGRIEPDPFFAENFFAGFEHDPQNDVTEQSGKRRGEKGTAAAGGVHQLRDNETGDDAGDRPADRDFIRDNEMLEVDEGGGDEERDEDPVRDRHFPRESFPDAKKKERRQKLDGKITKGDASAAVRAFAAQEKPAQERDVLVPAELLLARRAKRAARLVYRQIEWEAIDADVEE